MNPIENTDGAGCPELLPTFAHTHARTYIYVSPAGELGEQRERERTILDRKGDRS